MFVWISLFWHSESVVLTIRMRDLILAAYMTLAWLFIEISFLETRSEARRRDHYSCTISCFSFFLAASTDCWLTVPHTLWLHPFGFLRKIYYLHIWNVSSSCFHFGNYLLHQDHLSRHLIYLALVIPHELSAVSAKPLRNTCCFHLKYYSYVLSLT